MCWERREDCHNLVASALMTKIEFLDCKQYLHLTDYNALNSSDKLTNAWFFTLGNMEQNSIYMTNP